MPRKRGHSNRGKKSGRGSGGTAQASRGSHVQNVHGSVHQHGRGENLDKEKESAFQSLEEMFRETLDADVIHMVLAECDWKVDDALESLITLSGAGSESSRSVQLEDERSTLSGIASSLFTYPSRLDDMQDDLSGPTPSVRSHVGPRDEDFDVTDEEDHYDDFDLGTRDEMMLDQISDSIGISDDRRVVPPIKDFENNLEQIDDTPLLHSSVPARTRSDHQFTPNLPWNSKANLPDLTCLYPSSMDNTEARTTASVPDSSNKSNESPKGFAKSIQLAETYEKLAQSSNYYLYDFEEISSTSSFLNETESNPIDFELRSGGSPDLELYESGPFSETHGPLLADLEKRLGNTIPKPLELVTSFGANSGRCVDSNNVTSSEKPDVMSSPNTVKSDSPLMNEPLLPSVGEGEDSRDKSFNLISSKNANPSISVETIWPTRETDLYRNNSPLSVLEPALDAESLNNQTDNVIRGIYGSLEGPDVVTSIIQDKEDRLWDGQLTKTSESDAVDISVDFEEILAAAAAAAEAADRDDEHGDPSDDSEMGKKFVNVYTYSSTSSSKEDSPEPLGAATGKKICRKKKKRSRGAIQAVYSGSEDYFRKDADGLVKRMVGARDFLKNMNSEQSTVEANSEINLETNPERSVELETLCQRMFGFRNVLKTQGAEKSDSNVVETFDIDEMSDVKTLSHSDSESSDSSHRKTWPDILDLPNSSSKPIATISADVADRIPELEIMEYNLETIQESAEFSDGADDLSHEKGSIRRFITLDKIELPPKVQRQADLVATEDDIQVNVKEELRSEPGTDCDENGSKCLEDVVMAHGEVCGSSVQDAVHLEVGADATELMMADISADSVNVESIVRRSHEARTDMKAESELSAGSQCSGEIQKMGDTAIVNRKDEKTDDVAGVQGAEDTIKLLLGIGPGDLQESANNGDDLKSQTPSCLSGKTSQEIIEELSAADAPRPVKQPVLSDPDPEAMIKMMLSMEAASRAQNLSCDQGGNKKSDIISATGDIGADSAIKKLLGIGASDDKNRTSVIGSSVEQSGKSSPHESAAYETLASMKEGKVVQGQSKFSVNAEEFVPTGPHEHLHGVSAPGIFLPPNANLISSSDFPQPMPAFVTPKMNAGTTGVLMGLPPVPYQFNPVAAMAGFQQPFVPQPAFQSGVFYHSGENVVAPPNNGQGRGRSKEKRGGRKSPFSKLAANFNQFSQTELPAFMSVPPGLNHGARIPTRPDLRCSKQQFEKSGKISHIEQTGVSSEQPKLQSKDESTNYTVNSNYGKTSITEDHILPEKCSGSEQAKNPSFAAMAAKSTQGISNHPPQGKNTRSSRSQEFSANEDQVRTVRQHLDKGDKVLIMMRGCPGSGKSTLARQLLFSGVILSTDDFFISDDGRYLYEQEKIGDAHEWNQERALRNMKDGVSPIIIDNTNIQIWEMKPYVIKGIEHGYKVEIFEPNTPWQFKPGELARRNSHNVSKERITRMIDRYNRNVTVEQIVGSSDKLRTRAVQKQQANMQRTKDTKPKRTRSEKQQPAQTATTKSQPKVTNRFAILGDENEALTALEDEVIVETASVTRQALPIESEGISADEVIVETASVTRQALPIESEGISADEVIVETASVTRQALPIESEGISADEVIVETASVTRQALPIESEGISADVKVDDRTDDMEAESSGSQSGEITPDVVVESDGANSADGEEVAATSKDAVMKRQELLQDHSCVAVDKVDVNVGLSGGQVPNDSSESGIEVDSARVRDDYQSSKADVKKFKEADVVLSSAEKVFDEKETIVDSCVPAAGTLLGAEQTNLRSNVKVKTENVQVGSETLPSGKKSPRTGWAGWGSSTNKGSGPTVSKNQKLSSDSEWASTGENQSYFWSEAQGLVKDSKHVDVLQPKSENIIDLPCVQKPCVEVVSSAGENVWEEPKTRRERRQRNRDYDSPSSPSKVINTEPNVTDSHVGDNLSETLASCLIGEEKHNASDTANLLNVTGGAELDHGNDDLVEVSELSLLCSEVDSEIFDSVRQEGRSCHTVADISVSGQGNEVASNSEVETFQQVRKGAEAEAVCSADSLLNTDQSIKSETFTEEGTACTLEEAELDVEEETISTTDHGEIEGATRANSVKESDSTLKAIENVSLVEESNRPDLALETKDVDTVVEESAIRFDSDADISAADPSDGTHLPAVDPKRGSFKSGDVECVPSKFVQPDHTFEEGGETPSLLSLRDRGNNALEEASQQECASAKKLPDTTPSRKTKSQKQKLTPKQKFVKGIKEDILAIGKSLPQDWTLPDFLVTPSSVKLENDSMSVDTSEEPEMKECTDAGTHTSSHDFVLLYKIQKNLLYNLSDVKVIECNTNKNLSGWTAENASLSNSAPESPKKRAPFLLDKSCNTDEVAIPLSVEADLKFLKSCFPTVSEGDLKDILDNCGKDVEWAVNLLLDSGYEYNSPKATKEYAKSEGRDDDKDVDTAQEDLSEFQGPEHADVNREGEFLDTKAGRHHLASPDTQSCHQPGGLATLSQNVITDSNWLNSWGSLGGYNLPMSGEYHFDVSDLPFEQTTLLPCQKNDKVPQNGLTTATTPFAPAKFSDLDAIDNVEIKTRPQEDIVADHFGLIPSSECSNRPTSEFKTVNAHETANAQPPLQTSTPTVEANKYQRIIDTVTGGSTASHIEPIVYMPMPGIRKLKNSYDYLDQRKETGSDLASTVGDGSKSGDTCVSPDDTDEELNLKEEWSSEDCGLSMELSPAMALGLQELFGPVGFHVNAESLCPDDLKIGLSYNIARLLHEAWAKTLEEKMVKEENSVKQMLKSDAQLARQLQSEEDAMHHVTKVITMPRKKTASILLSPRRSHSPKNGQSPKTRRKYTDAPSSGITFKEELPGVQARASSPTTGLQQIMEEELAMKRKREEEQEKLSSSASHVTLAMRMKRQKLYELFPGLQESILDEIFESCGYALGPTVSAIRGSTEENPQSVFTSSNLSDYEEILVREAEVESNNPKYLGKSSDDYQTFEDPDYHDYRAEATLHYNIRHECFQKAQDAHRRGMKQVATFYSQQGHMHTEKIRAANKRASERILERRNSKLQQSNTLDLHGLHVSEAIEALEDILTQRQNENVDRPDKRKLHLYVVTGRGAHSKGGIAKIKPAIVSYLNRNGYRYSEPQLGMLRINVNLFAQ